MRGGVETDCHDDWNNPDIKEVYASEKRGF